MHSCDECGSTAANIHLTKIENNEVSAVHLCEECARGKGISLVIDPEKLGLAAGAVVPSLPVSAPPVKPLVRCTSCGLVDDEMERTGLLGCPACYVAFRERVDAVQLQFADTLAYPGRQYGASSGFEDEEFLRQELARAVRTENFEQAAALRDRLTRVLRVTEGAA